MWLWNYCSVSPVKGVSLEGALHWPNCYSTAETSNIILIRTYTSDTHWYRKENIPLQIGYLNISHFVLLPCWFEGSAGVCCALSSLHCFSPFYFVLCCFDRVLSCAALSRYHLVYLSMPGCSKVTHSKGLQYCTILLSNIFLCGVSAQSDKNCLIYVPPINFTFPTCIVSKCFSVKHRCFTPAFCVFHEHNYFAAGIR